MYLLTVDTQREQETQTRNAVDVSGLVWAPVLVTRFPAELRGKLDVLAHS